MLLLVRGLSRSVGHRPVSICLSCLPLLPPVAHWNGSWLGIPGLEREMFWRLEPLVEWPSLVCTAPAVRLHGACDAAIPLISTRLFFVLQLLLTTTTVSTFPLPLLRTLQAQ